MTEEEKLLDRIAKLHAKANDPSVTEAEAAIFTDKVAQLLAEHGLTMSRVEGRRRHGKIKNREWRIKYADPWRVYIINSVAKLYGCYMLNSKWWDASAGKTRPAVYIIGQPASSEAVELMSQYLIDTTVRLAREYSTQRAARLGFERGCGTRLANRVSDKRLEREREKEQRDGGGNPMNLPAVIADDRKAAEDWAKEEFNPVKGRSRGHTYNEHSIHGRRAANDVSLDEQVGHEDRVRI